MDNVLARNNYSYEKRQRDLAKKKKKEEKRQKKLNKGTDTSTDNIETTENTDIENTETKPEPETITE